MSNITSNQPAKSQKDVSGPSPDTDWANPKVIREINADKWMYTRSRDHPDPAGRRTSTWCVDVSRFISLLEKKARAPLAPSPPDKRWWVDFVLDKDIEIILSYVAKEVVWDDDDDLDLDFIDCMYTMIEKQRVLQEAGSEYAEKVAAVIDHIVGLSGTLQVPE